MHPVKMDCIFKAEYYRNKIGNRITDFIIQIGEGKKGWLSRGSVVTLHQVTTTERVVDLLNDAENKGLESYGQIIRQYHVGGLDIVHSKMSFILLRSKRHWFM